MGIVNLQNIKKNYFFLNVLKDISLNLEAGKFYGLLGENGAGKSTLFQIIVGLERPTSGCVKLFNKNLESFPSELKTEIGIISEKIELDTPLSMEKFFNFYRKFFQKWNQSLFDEIINHQKIDLSKPFKKYSRGQKMQMVLAAELSKSPKILLIDEITSVLDVYSRLFYLKKLEDFKENGGTIFLTTNVITEVENHLDHIFIIKNGKIIFNGNKDDIQKNKCPLDKKPLSLEVFFSRLHAPEKEDNNNDQAA
jgi:ABC-2 type transport system ATP-binding protein